MEKYIEIFISTLEKLEVEEAKKIKSNQDESTTLFLSGKIAGYEYCIKELKHIIQENKKEYF